MFNSIITTMPTTKTYQLSLQCCIFTATDQNLITVLTMIDKSSAFNCVLHEMLLNSWSYTNL